MATVEQRGVRRNGILVCVTDTGALETRDQPNVTAWETAHLTKKDGFISVEYPDGQKRLALGDDGVLYANPLDRWGVFEQFRAFVAPDGSEFLIRAVDVKTGGTMLALQKK